MISVTRSGQPSTYRLAGFFHVLLTGLLASSPALAQSADTSCCLRSTPPITRHAIELDSYPQNFSLVQSPEGDVYVGNYSGVAQFDGKQWDLVELPNGDVARSLATDARGRVYVGGINLFGHLDRDGTGQLQFTDLSAGLGKSFPDGSLGSVRTTLIHGNSVYFRASQHIIRFDPRSGSLTLWQTPSQFLALGIWQDQLVAHEEGRGLIQLFADAERRHLAGTEALPDISFGLIELPDGRLLSIGGDRWQAYDGQQLQALQVPDNMPAMREIRAATRLSEREIALTTSTGRLLIFEPDTQQLRILQLGSENLHSVIRSQDGGVLTASNNTLFHLPWPSHIGSINEADGLRGSIWAMHRWGDRWIGITDAGFQQLRNRADGIEILPLDWTDTEAWSLLPWTDTGALLAAGGGVWWMEGDRIDAVLPTEPITKHLKRSRHDPSVALVGTFSGLQLLRYIDGQWTPLLTIPGLDVAQMHEASATELWVGTETDAIHRIRLKPDLRSVQSRERLGAEHGLTLNRSGGAYVFSDNTDGWLATTEAGIYRWNGRRFVATELDGLSTLRDPRELLRLQSGPEGTQWAFSYKNIYRHDGDIWHRERIDTIQHGAIDHVAFESDGTALFSAGRTVIQVQPRPTASTPPPTQLQLRAIEHISDSGHTVRLRHDAPLEFPHGNFALRFRYSVPDVVAPEQAEFRLQMTGSEDWSRDWSPRGTITLFDLNPGTYQLKVEGRNSHGHISEAPTLVVSVRPPWYATAAAKLGWILLGMAVVMIAVSLMTRLRTRRLDALRQQLQQLVEARTTELASANAKLHALAHSDALTETANRRRLNEYLEDAWHHASVAGEPLSLLAIDVDNFKQFNDQNGHLAGDDMLVALVRAVEKELGDTRHLLARFGGDEFIVVLPNCGLHAAMNTAERVRAAAEATPNATTTTIGVASSVPAANDGSSIEDLTRAADIALYAAKSAGKNCVRNADESDINCDEVEFRRWA